MKKRLRQLSDNERKDRKGGKFSFSWIGHMLFPKLHLKKLQRFKNETMRY